MSARSTSPTIVAVGERGSIVDAVRAADPSGTAGRLAIVDLVGPGELDRAALEVLAGSDDVVVLIGVIGADRPRCPFTDTMAAREDVARSALPQAVTLRTAPVVEDLAVYAPAIAAGAPVFRCCGERPTRWVSAHDVVAVAVAAARDVVAGGIDRRGRSLAVTGERAVSGIELLEVMGAARVDAIPAGDLRAALTAAGHDQRLVDHVVGYEGWLGHELEGSRTVRAALGRAPLDPADAAALLRPAQERGDR